MMKRGHASHRGCLLPVHLRASLTALCLHPQMAATAETCHKRDSIQPPQQEPVQTQFYNYRSHVSDHRADIIYIHYLLKYNL